MNKRKSWVIVAIVTATAGFFVLQNGLAPQAQEENIATFTPTAQFILTDTPTLAYEGCAYVWATHDDPDLSKKMNDMIISMDTTATANVSLYGEDCVYADGHSAFGVMESDFHVRLPVQDLTKKEDFGNWMKQVMDQVVQIPRDEIQGKLGFVEFWFIKSGTENVVVQVPISSYQSNAQGKTGAELFNMYKRP